MHDNNMIYIVQSEICHLINCIKWSGRTGPRYYSEDNEPLIMGLLQLRDILNNVSDIGELDPIVVFMPFLEVIRSEETSGPSTGIALAAVDKFLNYQLFDPSAETSGPAVEAIADAITHARFVGTDPSKDEVVLLRILHVLQTLLFVPIGYLLSDESVCEMMQSCLRICLEIRLSELLRHNAESVLQNMVQLIFSRLPHLKQSSSDANSPTITQSASHPTSNVPTPHSPEPDSQIISSGNLNSNQSNLDANSQPISETIVITQTGDSPEPLPVTDNPCSNDDDSSESVVQPDSNDVTSSLNINDQTESVNEEDIEENPHEPMLETHHSVEDASASCKDHNLVGTDFELIDKESALEQLKETESSQNDFFYQPSDLSHKSDEEVRNVILSRPPYGVASVVEVFRFLLSLLRPEKNPINTLNIGLNLVSSAIEAGGRYFGQHDSLILLMQDDLCWSLMQLLKSDRISLFSSVLRLAYLLFESNRKYLKFQLEMYLQNLVEIISNEQERITYEQREISLDNLAQLCRIPGFVTELYLNFDCDPYSSSLLDTLIKLFSKNAFPVGRLLSSHVISLEALLSIVDTIERRCNSRLEIRSSKSKSTPTTSNALSAATARYKAGLWNMWSNIMSSLEEDNTESGTDTCRHQDKPPPPSLRIPTEEELAAAKYQKKLLINGSEKFNQDPKEGITYLQTHGLLATPLDPDQVAHFFRENPRLDLKMIGEYISKKKNANVLKAFVESFNFGGVRIEEALRHYLETFRLPGESPLIQHLLEYFAEEWHVSNNEPFKNVDAAFTLAYAILMLNTDQHNPNSRRQNIPMTEACFKKNLKGMNGGGPFDDILLSEIFYAIKNNEIVMPSEQTGLVKEKYLWKTLMRRCKSDSNVYIQCPVGAFDRDIFTVIWGPTVAALSFVFDKTMEPTIQQKSMADFRKCAMISAHYGLTDVFDNLIISLCKFTTLLNQQESSNRLCVTFGRREKARLAAKTMFLLALRHSDILREGWKSLLDCLLPLFKERLLPESLSIAEDFVSPDRKVSLILSDCNITSPKSEPGMLSTFYLYLTSDVGSKSDIQEEEAARQVARECIQECRIDQLIEDSRFLQDASLTELIKALIYSAKGDSDAMELTDHDQDGRLLYQEILVRVFIQNRDRVAGVWPLLHTYLQFVLLSAAERSFLLERAVESLLRLALRLLRRQEVVLQIFQCIRLLIVMKTGLLSSVSRHVTYGLHEVLRSHATSVPTPLDWRVIFTLLEACGSGAVPEQPFIREVMASLPNNDYYPGLYPTKSSFVHGRDATHSCPYHPMNSSDSAFETYTGVHSDSEHACSEGEIISTTSSPAHRPPESPQTGDYRLVSQSDLSRGYTSDSELYESHNTQGKRHHHNFGESKSSSWILLERSSISQATSNNPLDSQPSLFFSIDKNSIVVTRDWYPRDLTSLARSCATLVFLVRDPAIVTRDSCSACIQAIRIFVESCLYGGSRQPRRLSHHKIPGKLPRARNVAHSRHKPTSGKNNSNARNKGKYQQTSQYDSDSQEEFDENNEKLNSAKLTETVAIQLLDLLLSLHGRVANLYQVSQDNTEEENAVAVSACWEQCWCPLLQGLARLCCDARRTVRGQAITCLQRALLAPDLNLLYPQHWEQCLIRVLFPLLVCLLDNINPTDRVGTEETRMRASALLCKVFLQRLSLLMTLPSFTSLWVTILHFLQQFMHADESELLADAIPECLKNMLLVMYTANVLLSPNSEIDQSNDQLELWTITWKTIEKFLPSLQQDLFPTPPVENQSEDAVSPESVSEDFAEREIVQSAGVSSVAPQIYPPTTDKLVTQQPKTNTKEDIPTTGVLCDDIKQPCTSSESTPKRPLREIPHVEHL